MTKYLCVVFEEKASSGSSVKDLNRPDASSC